MHSFKKCFLLQCHTSNDLICLIKRGISNSRLSALPLENNEGKVNNYGKINVVAYNLYINSATVFDDYYYEEYTLINVNWQFDSLPIYSNYMGSNSKEY
jgi:hypothetical protein